uniref:Uncharacterized protein n=1 Tax=uncultured gamma proteobacterium HF0010_01E20 TaxID=710977 RepID=E0XQ77_9GAMM|nr:hypothetical protein [uncultured gamma proteobacterium HF0010_01E20]
MSTICCAEGEGVKAKEEVEFVDTTNSDQVNRRHLTGSDALLKVKTVWLHLRVKNG